MNSNEMLQTIIIKKLQHQIANAGCSDVECTMESILDNLGYLATERTDFGESKKYVPLSIKEIILSLLYEKSYIHCELIHSADYTYWESNAYVYFDANTEKANGEGRFAFTLAQYASENSMTEEAAKCSIGNWVRGLAKTRAIQDALPFLNLYCTEDDVNADSEPNPPLPVPESIDSKKSKKETITKEPEKETQKNEDISESISDNSSTCADTKTVSKNVDSKEILDDKETQDNNNKSMTLEEARQVIADVGNCKGYSLGEIYDKQPKNIIWLYQRGGSERKEALKVIIDQDEDLQRYLLPN